MIEQPDNEKPGSDNSAVGLTESSLELNGFWKEGVFHEVSLVEPKTLPSIIHCICSGRPYYYCLHSSDCKTFNQALNLI